MTTEPIANNLPDRASFSRRIRSFIRREGRLTVAQTRALDELMPRFGLAAEGPRLDPAKIFGRIAPLTLEIGFGNGESLLDMAQAAPEQDFIGIEVHRPGVGHLLLGIEQRGLTNIRVMNDDAVPFIQQRIGPGQLDRLLLYFPDPWHKARHHKRRIVQPEFASLIAERLKPEGMWHLATDWADYAEHMRAVLDAHPDFTAEHQGTGEADRPAWRPETKFERRGIRLGHQVFDLIYRRNPDQPQSAV
ncbi:MAG TPA: tRNA (guanosine(46)-N7)-methyltransferase TrmB [Halothiobacillus sp.]|nr:tRNA (guanosine(46)-N7)-methyltransferase TrmB [Halothiobacillus sp.]